MRDPLSFSSLYIGIEAVQLFFDIFGTQAKLHFKLIH